MGPETPREPPTPPPNIMIITIIMLILYCHVMVGSEDIRPPGGGNSSLLGGRPVQTAQLNAHGLHQAAGAGPLSWPPRMAYQAALNTLHTRRDSRPLRSLKTASC